ncbi:MAG TPA: CoA-binding protein [Syntrophomonadaceae bacterium]|nr:CoA-binding protein [Syntrophomonadaceae bacterium]
MEDFFIRFKKFAVVGLSGNPKSFSRGACNFLKSQGCSIYPVNPHVGEIDGQACYSSLDAIPEVLQAAIFFTNPRVTVEQLELCKEKGITRVWFQQGSADDAVIHRAKELGLQYKNSCVFLHQPNAGFPHNFHRLINKVFRIDM